MIPDSKKHFIFIGGGIIITVILAIIYFDYNTELFGNTSKNQLYFSKSEIERYAKKANGENVKILSDKYSVNIENEDLEIYKFARENGDTYNIISKSNKIGERYRREIINNYISSIVTNYAENIESIMDKYKISGIVEKEDLATNILDAKILIRLKNREEIYNAGKLITEINELLNLEINKVNGYNNKINNNVLRIIYDYSVDSITPNTIELAVNQSERIQFDTNYYASRILNNEPKN